MRVTMGHLSSVKVKNGRFSHQVLCLEYEGRSIYVQVNAISNWKWRVSYGMTGNRAIGPFQTLATLRADQVLSIVNNSYQ
jgi:hypothetical protein